MTRAILLAGSTGLVGRQVAALARARALALTPLVRAGSSAQGLVIDYEALCADPAPVLAALVPGGVDVVISCLGTTQKTAGSQAGFFRVDHDYVLALAQGAKALGARQFIMITAAGAGGPGFYLKTKGRIEDAVTQLGLPRLDIVRPGLLLGARQERRPAEEIGQRFAKALKYLLPGPLAKVGPVSAEVVASAIISLAGRAEAGRFVHENREIEALAAGSSAG